MANLNPHLRQALLSGLVYGLGLALGNVVSQILFKTVSPEFFWSGNQAARLVIGILLAFFISGAGGFIGGFAGGLTLPMVDRPRGRWGYAWPSAVSLGLGYGLLLFPAILIIALMTFYQVSTISARVFSLAFGGLGLVLGLLIGLVMGVWTLRGRFPLVTWSSGLGFGLGGLGLGYFLWRHLNSVLDGRVESGQWLWLLLGLFLFGALGGAGLGFAFRYTASRGPSLTAPLRRLGATRRRRRLLLAVAALLLLCVLLRPVVSAVGDMLTPVDAGLARVLDLNTLGTHWLDTVRIAGTIAADDQPALAAGRNGQVVLSWIGADGAVYLLNGQWSSADRQTGWATPVRVSGSDHGQASKPQVILDNTGAAHVVWVESSTETQAEAPLYSRCLADQCTLPVRLPGELAEGCGLPAAAINQNPALALDGNNRLLVIWETEAGVLPYLVWDGAGQPPPGPADCVPVASGGAAATQPRLSPAPDNRFILAFRQGQEGDPGQIQTIQYAGGEWTELSPALGQGHAPAILVDDAGQLHLAWCAAGDQVIYWHDGTLETVASLPCLSRPELVEDSNGEIHLVWSSDRVKNVSSRSVPNPVLYESVRVADSWQPAAIVSPTDQVGQSALAGDAATRLHLAWPGSDGIYYAAQLPYSCEGYELSRLGQVVYDIARQETYLPPADPVPFCQNRYERIIYTPNPDPAYSDQPIRPNNAFDLLGDLIQTAQYEVLFSTMWYNPAENNDSPGSVIAAAVAELYANLKAHPDQYPRGLTVRIMLGNPPELILGETSGQLWSLLADLRRAGIDRMVDEEIGWRLEVADYEGNVPHSHVKTVIIDGKTVVAAGFNMTYEHLDQDHPSGRGEGRFDMGIQVTGPVAQAAQRMFDDMWNGADGRHCLSLNPPFQIPWQATCYDFSTQADHLPEVRKFYLPADGTSTAFSLYRSKAYDQADRQTVEAIGRARQSVDAIHVNFTLEMICNLNFLFDVCTFDQSPDYMPALLQAARNGAKVRILVKPTPMDSIENTVAINAFERRLERLGLADRVELRLFNGPTHPKSTLIDDQLLIIGSQNFHYSAFGAEGGLNEYSLAVEDPQAVEDFKQMFEYQWQQAAID